MGSEYLAIDRVENQSPEPNSFTSWCSGTSAVTNAANSDLAKFALDLIITHCSFLISHDTKRSQQAERFYKIPYLGLHFQKPRKNP